MKKEIHRSEDRGKSELGWLSSRFSFSFADYSNDKRRGFGKLIVLNDDTIKPGKGFGAHQHENMEIITLVTKGELEHKDSLGNIEILKEGEMQVMSAGRGITHSEYNHSKTNTLELFQLWIETASPQITPRHETREIKLKNNQITQVVSGDQKNLDLGFLDAGNFFQKRSFCTEVCHCEQTSCDLSDSQTLRHKKDNLLFINQDATIYLGKFSKEQKLKYRLNNNRGIFIFVIDGIAIVEDEAIYKRDSIEIIGNSDVVIQTKPGLYLIIVEVPL